MSSFESRPLPIRVAHPARPQLDHLDDAYFEFLAACGYEGLYLQDSPFDSLTGNHGAFKKCFHLIYLYDIARGPRRQEYVDYIAEVCRRAARHGLKTHLCLWEPRLPLSAWAETPPSWRGRGGFAYAGRCNMTSFCWSEKAAVEYWKHMAFDAFSAVPDIAGVHLGLVDNEASFCDASCPKCKGTTGAQLVEDLYSTLRAIKNGRAEFRIAIYDWWLPEGLMERLSGIIGDDALVIGRSSQGHRQDSLPGKVEDMTAIFSGCGPEIIRRKAVTDKLGLRLVDMPAWSHPNEAWWLPASPEPAYAVEKLNSLRSLGAVGWYDFDCGATEPGSIADAIVVWTKTPDAPVDSLVRTVLTDIFVEACPAVGNAYRLFRAGKQAFPIAYANPSVTGFSGRCLGLGLCLFGPFRLEDFRLLDLGHVFNWFAPFNLVTPDTIPVVVPRLEQTTAALLAAYEEIQSITVTSSRARREVNSFEIHYRHYRAIRNYFLLGQAKWDLLEERADQAAFGVRVREIASDELDNLTGIETWALTNPNALMNPCHSLIGTLEEVWPDTRFVPSMFAAKRQSLLELATAHEE